jgi:hypothetical protein
MLVAYLSLLSFVLLIQIHLGIAVEQIYPIPSIKKRSVSTRAYIVNAFHFLFYSFLPPSRQAVLGWTGLHSQIKTIGRQENTCLSLIDLYPNYSYAYVQLAYIYMWEGDFFSSHAMLKQVRAQLPM